MAIVNAEVRFAPKLTAWFTANPTKVLQDGEIVYCSDGANIGKYVIGDNSTALSGLTFYGGISSSGLTIGTTTITSGTNTRILYNNSGVVGEYTFQTVHKGLLVSSGVCLGDSTIASYLAQNSVGSYLLHSADSLLGNTIASLANPGDTILQQQTAWTADGNKATYDYIIVQVGLNDVDPTEAASVAIARYQTLVNTINSGKKSTAQVMVCTMTPCYNRLVTVYGASAGTAYTKWLDMNTAIMGGGATPITGVDQRVNKHTNSLNTGSGALADIYEVTGTVDGIHENNLGRDIIANCWREGLQEMGFLKTHPTETMQNSFEYDGTYIRNVKGTTSMYLGGGFFNVGNKNTTNQRLARFGQDTSWIDIGSMVGATSYGALYMNNTPSSTNWFLSSTNGTTNFINGSTTLGLCAGGTQVASVTGSMFYSNTANIGNKAITNQRILRIGQDTAWIDMGSYTGSTSYAGLYMNCTTPASDNHFLASGDGVNNIVHGKTSLILASATVAIATLTSTTFTIESGKILKLGNAATTGLSAGALAATTNASIVITDSTGQAYRIPCII